MTYVTRPYPNMTYDTRPYLNMTYDTRPYLNMTYDTRPYLNMAYDTRPYLRVPPRANLGQFTWPNWPATFRFEIFGQKSAHLGKKIANLEN